MSVLESWLTNIWYGSKKPPLALRILTRIYAYVIGKLAPIATEKLPVPVVVVGNFTVGGTGKTPLIIALAEYLSSQGYCPGVISRGYSRKTKTPISVDASSTVEQVGDEPFLIARRATVPVRVDAERFRAAQFLIAHGCNIIISDDGLQHRALPRTLEIEVLDTQRGYGNGLLLPAGPLREPIRPVALRVLNGSMTDTDTAYAMQLHMSECWQLSGGQRKPLQAFAGQTVQAVAGIGNPQRFFDALSAAGLSLESHAFADHHPFVANDLPILGPILMTEKDAVKCIAMNRADIWVVPVDASLSVAFFKDLAGKIESARGLQHA